MPLIKRKLAIPQVWSGALPRPSLIADVARSVGEGRHVVLLASAGYGKTTLAASCASAWPTAWVTLDAQDTEPSRLVTYLAGAFIKAVPDFETEAATMMAPVTPPEAVDAALSTLLSDIDEQCNEALMLVLDDFHRAESRSTLSMLAQLLAYLPPTVRVLLTARLPPALELSAMEARREVRILRESDLAFDLDELCALRPGVDPVELGSLWQTTGGWPAALGMDHATRESFLDEQLLGNQPPAARAFLLRAAQLESFEDVDCEAAIGMPLTADLRERMLRYQLFRAAEGGRFEVPEPLRGLLRRRFLVEISVAERVEIQDRIAAFLWSDGASLDAIRLWIDAGLSRRAADTLAAHSDALLADGRFEIVSEALDALGDEANKPELHIARGEIARGRGRLDEALAHFKGARDSLSRDSSAIDLARVYVREAQILAIRGQAREALELLDQAAPEFAVDSRLAVDALNIEGALFLFQGELPAAVQRFEESARIARERGDPHGRARAAHNLGVCLTRLGALTQALEAYETALPREGELPAVWLTPSNRALVMSFLGRLQEARRAAFDALTLVRRYRLSREEGYALRTLGHICLQGGEVDPATACFDSAVGLARKTGDPIGLAVSLNYRADAASIAGDAERALEFCNEAEATLRDSQTTYSSLEFAYVRSKVLVRAGRLTEAAAVLEPAGREATASGFAYWSYVLGGVALRIASATGQVTEAERLRGGLIESARQKGYGPLDLGASLGGNDEASSGRAHIAMAPLAASEGVQSPHTVRATQEESPEELTIRCFGAFRVHGAAGEVTDKNWQSTKVKLLLAFLLEQPDGASRDQIHEAIYGLEEEVSNPTFFMNFVRLRKALEPDLERGRASRFILRGDGRYYFNWQTRIDYDAQAFESALRGASIARANGDAREEATRLLAAAARYSGEYLQDFHADWVLSLRQRYRDRAIGAYRRLVALETRRDRVLELIFQALAVDPLSEEFNRELLLTYIEGGETQRAREHLELCTRRYQDLGLDLPDDFAPLVETH